MFIADPIDTFATCHCGIHSKFTGVMLGLKLLKIKINWLAIK